MREDSPSGAPALVGYLTYAESDGRQIDLAQLLASFWRRRWLVVAITVAFAVLGIAWALLSPPIFRVEVVLAPTQSSRTQNLAGRFGGLASLAGLNLNVGGDSTHAFAILSSRAFAESFIKDNDLLPVLYPEEWDSKAKTWKSNNPSEQPNLWKAAKFFTEEVLSVHQDDVTGLVTLAVEWTDPELAAVWAEELVKRINDQLRVRDLELSERKLEYLNGALAGANLLETRQAISSVIEEQVQTITLAKGEVEYAFRVIDPPRVPMERERPKRALIAILATILGGLISLCVVSVLYLVERMYPRAR